ncbi:MAG: CoA transferase [Actinomycetota bacterium]|nr:CoA transferase [Actinomycetota bacterium]
MVPVAPPDVTRWALSGAAALTGRPDGPPLGPPAGLVRKLDRLARPLAGVAPLSLITERAAIAGLARQGRTSCGGSCRLLRTVDGWLAVSLPRPDDIDLLPAWLEVEPSQLALGPPQPSDQHRPPAAPAAPWSALAYAVEQRSAAELEARAALLGLAVGGLASAPDRVPVRCTPLGDARALQDVQGLLVVDLSALWAGPLCGALLADAGATVVKVESTTRPDGARAGPSAFFDRLNHAKRSVALDLTDPAGTAVLRRLVAQADVVIDASRPRATRHLGIDPVAAVQAGGPRVWVSITAHGRDGDPGRIGFGDDAAIAGGLSVTDATGPLFCVDAIADPCSGLAAAAACIDALISGGRWLLDVAMSAVAADLCGPTQSIPAGLEVRPPAPPAKVSAAPALGAHTRSVLRSLDGPA